MKYLALIIFWSLWCAVHSGMISLTVSGYLKSRFGTGYRFYRLLYNFVALTTLAPLILYSQSLKGAVLFRWEGYMTIVQIVLLITVFALFVSGGLKYDMLHFFGIRQIMSGKLHSTLSESGDLDTSGVLNLTRNPWYLAAIIFIWIGYREMYVSTVIVNIILTIYLITGTLLEERKLTIELEDNYRDYIYRVSMLFPVKWITTRWLTAKKEKTTGH
jgi:methanethiol S-methyltransferase